MATVFQQRGCRCRQPPPVEIDVIRRDLVANRTEFGNDGLDLSRSREISLKQRFIRLLERPNLCVGALINGNPRNRSTSALGVILMRFCATARPATPSRSSRVSFLFLVLIDFHTPQRGTFFGINHGTCFQSMYPPGYPPQR